MVEQSTTTAGAAFDDSSPAGPVSASIRSWEVPTVTNTMSRPASSAAESTIFAPAAASGSALAFVRLCTATSQPAASSRRTSSEPIRPVPSQPSLRSFPCSVISPPRDP